MVVLVDTGLSGAWWRCFVPGWRRPAAVDACTAIGTRKLLVGADGPWRERAQRGGSEHSVEGASTAWGRGGGARPGGAWAWSSDGRRQDAWDFLDSEEQGELEVLSRVAVAMVRDGDVEQMRAAWEWSAAGKWTETARTAVER